MGKSDLEKTERARMLEQFAGGGGSQQVVQPSLPAQHQMSSGGLSEQVFGAQPCARYRDEAQVLQKITAIAAAAGTDWYYRIPVRDGKTGRQDWQEGPTIKLANDVARIFGNNTTQVRTVDVGDAWEFLVRFTDLENGVSMERPYRQRKSQSSMRTRDFERQLDANYQIGVSKAIRNCICNALQIYTNYAVEQAKNSLVQKIGKDLESWRNRTVAGLQNIPVELARVERIIGRPAKDWLAPNVAQVISMMNSIADGMAAVDDMFPPIGERTDQAAKRQPAEKVDPETGEVTPAAAAATDETEDPAPAPNVIEIAYQRGREWKAQDKPRKAVPGEYRDNTRLATAWLAGYDGKLRPAFADTEEGR